MGATISASSSRCASLHSALACRLSTPGHHAPVCCYHAPPSAGPATDEGRIERQIEHGVKAQHHRPARRHMPCTRLRRQHRRHRCERGRLAPRELQDDAIEQSIDAPVSAVSTCQAADSMQRDRRQRSAMRALQRADAQQSCVAPTKRSSCLSVACPAAPLNLEPRRATAQLRFTLPTFYFDTECRVAR